MKKIIIHQRNQNFYRHLSFHKYIYLIETFRSLRERAGKKRGPKEENSLLRYCWYTCANRDEIGEPKVTINFKRLIYRSYTASPRYGTCFALSSFLYSPWGCNITMAKVKEIRVRRMIMIALYKTSLAALFKSSASTKNRINHSATLNFRDIPDSQESLVYIVELLIWMLWFFSYTNLHKFLFLKITIQGVS